MRKSKQASSQETKDESWRTGRTELKSSVGVVADTSILVCHVITRRQHQVIELASSEEQGTKDRKRPDWTKVYKQ